MRSSTRQDIRFNEKLPLFINKKSLSLFFTVCRRFYSGCKKSTLSLPLCGSYGPLYGLTGFTIETLE